MRALVIEEKVQNLNRLTTCSSYILLVASRGLCVLIAAPKRESGSAVHAMQQKRSFWKEYLKLLLF